MNSERQFVEHLWEVTNHFFRALDAWESAYTKYYRLPAHGRVSSDMQEFQQVYDSARADLLHLLPEATRLCYKYGLPDPWRAVMHVRLGHSTPQAGGGSAVGRAERRLIEKCLDGLLSKAGADPSVVTTGSGEPRWHTKLFGRIYNQLF